MSLGLRSVRCLILQLQCSILLAPSLVLRRHGMRLPEVLQLVRLRRCLELRQPLVLRLVPQVLRLVPLVLLRIVRMLLMLLRLCLELPLVLQVLRLVPLVLLHMIRLLVLLLACMRPIVRVMPHTPSSWTIEAGCEVNPAPDSGLYLACAWVRSQTLTCQRDTPCWPHYIRLRLW